MKRQEPSKHQSVPASVPASGPQPSRFSVSCKFLCYAIFIIGVLLHVLLTTILIFGVENYHKADPVKIYEVFETPKYAETNNLLDNTQYLVLYGQPQSGIINFIQHEANLRAIEGKPVVKREIEENIIHKHIKESKHFLEMYLGEVPRGHHSWFILLDNTETPDLEIEALKKKYPKDSIILVAHQKLNVLIQGFVNHKFPDLKAKELKDFMEKDLNICPKEVKQVIELASNKDAPGIFEAYKDFEENKARAIEEAQMLKKQHEEEERLRLEEEARKPAAIQGQEKKSKKDKKGSKGKKGKVAEPQEEVKEAQPVQQQQQASKKKKSGKKSKSAVPQPQVIEQAKEQQPVKESKKKGKKSSKKQPIEKKIEEQLQQTLEEIAVESVQEIVVDEEPKKGKGKKNKNNKSKTSETQADQPQKEQKAQVQVSVLVEEVKEEVAAVVQQVAEAVEEFKEQGETREGKKSKGKGKGKKGEEQKETKKGKKGGKKSTNDKTPSRDQQTNQSPSSQQPSSDAIVEQSK